jgi:chemotaxis protein MotB
MLSTHPGDRLSTHQARATDAAYDRLAVALLLSVLLHGVLLAFLDTTTRRADASWEPTFQPVALVDTPHLGSERAEAQDASASAITSWVDFEDAATARLAAVERDLTAAVAQQAQAARAEAEGARAEAEGARAEVQALNAEVARGATEQLRLAEDAQALRQALASREAELGTAAARAEEAAARAADAERALEEARRQAAEAAAWKAAYADLERTFHREIAAKEVALQRLAHGVSLTIADRILFPSGTADIVGDGVQVLNRIAGVLERFPGQRVRIEGHTDDVPIGPVLRSRYPSNWELSTARATAMVKYLVTRGIAPSRLGAAGYAETRSVAPNTTEAGREQNRRIEVVLVPDESAAAPSLPAPPLPAQGGQGT